MSEFYKYYFKGKQVMSKSAYERLWFSHRYHILNMLQAKLSENGYLNHLQVFDLKAIHKDGKMYQQITHSQETPSQEIEPFSYTKEFECNLALDEKIYVIDNISRHTIMLASEYRN